MLMSFLGAGCVVARRFEQSRAVPYRLLRTLGAEFRFGAVDGTSRWEISINGLRKTVSSST